MKKEVNICDICKTRISKNHCALCEKDVCQQCSSGYNPTEIKDILKIIFCNKCRDGVRKLSEDKDLVETLGLKEDYREFIEKIKPKLTKGILAKNIEGPTPENEYKDTMQRIRVTLGHGKI